MSHVARMIVEDGLLDVDFARLAKRYRFTEEALWKAANHSLYSATRHAMDIVTEDFDWPVYYPHWREFLHQNSMLLWDFLYENEGYARLYANGVIPEQSMYRVAVLLYMLRQLGFPSRDIPLLLNATVLMVIAERVDAEALASQTGNIAELYSDYLLDTKNRQALDTGYSLGLKHSMEANCELAARGIPPEEAALVKEVATDFYASSIFQPRGWLEARLELILDGIEAKLAADTSNSGVA